MSIHTRRTCPAKSWQPNCGYFPRVSASRYTFPMLLDPEKDSLFGGQESIDDLESSSHPVLWMTPFAKRTGLTLKGCR